MESVQLDTGFTQQAAPVLVPTVILLLAVYLSTKFIGTSGGTKLPEIASDKAKYWSNARQLLREGYSKYNAFRMTTTKGSTVMLTRDAMVELIKRPDEVPLEFELPVKFDFQSKYTGLMTYNPVVNNIIRDTLTPGKIAAEVDNILGTEFPQTDKFEKIQVFDIINRVVSIAAGSILIGKDLCYRDEWVKTSIDYTMAVVMGALELKSWPAFLRPFVYRRLPRMQGIKEHEKMIKGLLMPTIRARRAQEGKPGYQKPDDFLQWYMDKAAEFNQDDERVALGMLGVGMVSINSTAKTATHALYDLALQSEYQKPLREELKHALKESGGDLSKDALHKCHLLDSFLKESQRCNPEIFVFGKRILLKDFTLSDGTFLPKGTLTTVPLDAVIADPKNYEKPEEFDGYRHYRPRQQGGFAGEKHQWISSNKTTLNFGYGRHSCPGRFFATVEIKLIFAFILLHYEVKLLPGEGRPANVLHGDSQSPNPTASLLFRKID
ncbi:cytochrome P450 [Aulographum hederae CBS 113979]|uniref:Cytochrome P450 n=1 Tax=Aulographum hederae CBS 113979 TaxID=1176131 RepID=A0A6G1GPP5_9PEZI|nr:cytochrome P450 [Aulographum hederae CBS 113979]